MWCIRDNIGNTEKPVQGPLSNNICYDHIPKVQDFISIQVCLAKDHETNLWDVKGWSQRSQAHKDFISPRHAQALPRGCVQYIKHEASKNSGKIKPKHLKYMYAWMHFCHIATFLLYILCLILFEIISYRTNVITHWVWYSEDGMQAHTETTPLSWM